LQQKCNDIPLHLIWMIYLQRCWRC